MKLSESPHRRSDGRGREGRGKRRCQAESGERCSSGVLAAVRDVEGLEDAQDSGISTHQAGMHPADTGQGPEGEEPIPGLVPGEGGGGIVCRQAPHPVEPGAMEPLKPEILWCSGP